MSPNRSPSNSAENSSGAITTPEGLEQTKSPKQFTRRLFTWLDQVMADPDLPPSAKIVAYAIGQHINRQSRDAFPGTDRLAACIAMSRATVIEMVRRLEAAGHLGVDPGAQGRGHSNRYTMIVKRQQANVFGLSKRQQANVLAKPGIRQPADLKRQRAENKRQPADMNHCLTTLTTQSAPAARSTARVDRGHKTETEKTADDAPPIQRAPGGALIEPVAAQQQPPRNNPIGTAANGRAAPATNAWQAGFQRVTAEWPPDHIIDDAKAFFVCCRALDALGDIDDVVDAIITMKLERGADLPDLADALAAIIERNLAITANQSAQEDER